MTMESVRTSITRRQAMSVAGSMTASHSLSGVRADSTADRIRWWQQARFGMFIHWGIYALTGRGEWEMYTNHWPVAEYSRLADRFQPRFYNPTEWVAIARDAGMKYVVLTTRHHDGFCLFDSRVSDFTSTRTAARRDLVAEYAEACHKAGMPMGFYYSLGSWRFPGLTEGKPVQDLSVYGEMVEQTHAQVRELCTNYGKIDILWYDGAYPDQKIFRAAKLNAMVRRLQPHILINDRSGQPEDFATPEGEVRAEKRPWEACITMHSTWGYRPGERGYKPIPHLIALLCQASALGGNLLLNVGPDADGRIPGPAIERLRAIGSWLRVHGEAIYGTTPFHTPHIYLGATARKGNKVYLMIHHMWPGSTVPFAWFPHRVQEACLLSTGQKVRVEQKGDRVWLHDLPENWPEPNVPVIALTIEE